MLNTSPRIPRDCHWSDAVTRLSKTTRLSEIRSQVHSCAMCILVIKDSYLAFSMKMMENSWCILLKSKVIVTEGEGGVIEGCHP